MNNSIFLVFSAVLIDLIIGDPYAVIHPVVLMGKIISLLQIQVEKFAKDSKFGLRVGGLIITLIVVSLSMLSGWTIERIYLNQSIFPGYICTILFIFCLASTLAAKSLRQSVQDVLLTLGDKKSYKSIEYARIKLGRIVGRDVNNLSESEILRATAETASENSVDGIFAPLFWMIIGVFIWNYSNFLPGPLSFSLGFKASSTIDSMLGYQHGRLKWLGTAGAKLDDILTWLPCRIVVISMTLISYPCHLIPSILQTIWAEGRKDLSPNAGLSEAVFAHCAGVRMGGINYYKGKEISKNILAKNAANANKENIEKILNISLKLEILWVLFSLVFFYFI